MSDTTGSEAEKEKPWIRTADRPPTEGDADSNGTVFALYEGKSPCIPKWDIVANYPSWPYWMPIPALPVEQALRAEAPTPQGKAQFERMRMTLEALRYKCTPPSSNTKERREWTGEIWCDYVFHLCDDALKGVESSAPQDPSVTQKGEAQSLAPTPQTDGSREEADNERQR
jgi:hypothetical protein